MEESENVTNPLTIFVSSDVWVHLDQVSSLCGELRGEADTRIVVWVVLQTCGLLSCLTIIPIITCNHILNDVIRNLLVTTVLLNMIVISVNASLGTFLLLDCDLDYLVSGGQTLLASYYQLFSVWTFVATAAMTYEISRMRFYFAKHAFRIHKLSNLHISTQVILEAFALSSLFLLILSYFSTITLFSNFPSLYSKINKIDRSNDCSIIIPVFLANVVAIIYYYKLCKHVKRRYQSVGVMGGVAQSLSPSATKYVTQDQHTRDHREPRPPVTPKIITSEVGFLMMTSSQLLVTVVFVIMVILDTDHERIDFRTQCFITFSHGIMTPLVMATFAVMEHRSKEEDIKQFGGRLQRRLKKTSRHKRHLARTRQVFKLPRCTERRKQSPEHGGECVARETRDNARDSAQLQTRSLDIWTVCSSGSVVPTSGRNTRQETVIKQTVAWGEERDLEQLTQAMVQKFYGRKRDRFKGDDE